MLRLDPSFEGEELGDSQHFWSEQMKKWSCLLRRRGGSRRNRSAGKIKSWVLGCYTRDASWHPREETEEEGGYTILDFGSQVQTEEKKSIIKP